MVVNPNIHGSTTLNEVTRIQRNMNYHIGHAFNSSSSLNYVQGSYTKISD